VSAALVRSLFDAMQSRDWEAARAIVADDAVVEYPISGERFSGASWMAMNEAYPEGWTIRVADVIAEADRIAARVAVEQNGEIYWCCGWYTTDTSRITAGVEIWATEASEQPPEWRRPFWLTSG
jgi:ketosteroid isomerase-like protein